MKMGREDFGLGRELIVRRITAIARFELEDEVLEYIESIFTSDIRQI
jgi:hypothetical protein